MANAGDFVDPSTVSVFNGATWLQHGRDAHKRRHQRSFRRHRRSRQPDAIHRQRRRHDLDSADHTVYVANLDYPDGDTVSMIDSATCNGTHLSDCPSTEPPTVTVGEGPGDIDVDLATHTAYVAQTAGVAVFDTQTCNATTQTPLGATTFDHR